MDIDNNTWVLLWSREQDTTVVETVATMLDQNLRSFERGQSGGYIALAFSRNKAELDAAQRRFTEVRNARIDAENREAG